MKSNSFLGRLTGLEWALIGGIAILVCVGAILAAVSLNDLFVREEQALQDQATLIPTTTPIVIADTGGGTVVNSFLP